MRSWVPAPKLLLNGKTFHPRQCFHQQIRELEFVGLMFGYVHDLDTSSFGVGWVRFVGKHKENDRIHIGVELESPVGDHDGEVDGHRYFSCAAARGVLVWERDILC